MEVMDIILFGTCILPVLAFVNILEVKPHEKKQKFQRMRETHHPTQLRSFCVAPLLFPHRWLEQVPADSERYIACYSFRRAKIRVGQMQIGF
jgi:hypothetical protein